MLAIWPLPLPQVPLADGFSATPEPNVITFQSDVGVEHSRRRSTAPRELLVCPFILDGNERAIFVSFFRNDLKDGALTYKWVHPVEQVAGTFKIVSHTLSNVGGDNWRLIKQTRRLT